MTNPSTGKKITPRPSTIIKHINAAAAKKKLPVEWSEKEECWVLKGYEFSFNFTMTVKGNDRIHAKDVAKGIPGISSRSIISERVKASKQWVVEINVAPRFSSFPAVRNEAIALLSELATTWTTKISKGGAISATSDKMLNKRVLACKFELIITKSQQMDALDGYSAAAP